MVNPKLFGLVAFVAGVLIATYYTIWAFSILVSLEKYDFGVALHETFLPRIYELPAPTSSLPFLASCYRTSWRNFINCALHNQDGGRHGCEKSCCTSQSKTKLIIQFTKLISTKNNITTNTKQTNTLIMLISPSRTLCTNPAALLIMAAFCISFFTLPVSVLLLTTLSSIRVSVMPCCYTISLILS